MKTNTLIIGASAAGLSCAAQLKHRGVPYLLIEKHPHVGNAWRQHYDRLHLHTNRSGSNLPFIKFPIKAGKYPSKSAVIKYLEDYTKTLDLKPVFETSAEKIEPINGDWTTTTNHGTIQSRHVIVCCGNAHTPKKYSRPGIETFPGKIISSDRYKNGNEFVDKKVLVVGFGNSACEIALCLHEHGARPSLSVRSPVNVIPRDILGIPVHQIGIWQSHLPPKLTDTLNKPLLRFLMGDIEKYGLKKLPYGPREQMIDHHSIPLIDIGTMALIRSGEIRIFGEVNHFDHQTVAFEDGKREDFDAIITAIGYEHGLTDIVDLSQERKSDLQLPLQKRETFGQDGLYFCGYFVSPTGMLREINIESGIIADKIASS